MNSHEIKLLSLAMILAFGVSACDKPVSAEKTGAEVGQEVDKASDKIDAASEKLNIETTKTRLALEDSTMTAMIETKFSDEPDLKSSDISVNTFDSVVTLTGTLSSQDLSDEAQGIAQNTRAVKNVNNKIVVSN